MRDALNAVGDFPYMSIRLNDSRINFYSLQYFNMCAEHASCLMCLMCAGALHQAMKLMHFDCHIYFSA
jgi:hypothetical protein